MDNYLGRLGVVSIGQLEVHVVGHGARRMNGGRVAVVGRSGSDIVGADVIGGQVGGAGPHRRQVGAVSQVYGKVLNVFISKKKKIGAYLFE